MIYFLFWKCSFYTLTFVPEILITHFFVLLKLNRKCYVLFLGFVMLPRFLCSSTFCSTYRTSIWTWPAVSNLYVGQWSAKYMSLITCFDFYNFVNFILWIILHLASVNLGSKKLQALTILVFHLWAPSTGLLLNRFARYIDLLSFSNRVFCRKWSFIPPPSVLSTLIPLSFYKHPDFVITNTNQIISNLNLCIYSRIFSINTLIHSLAGHTE